MRFEPTSEPGSLTEAQRTELRAAMTRTHFVDWDKTALESDAGQAAMEDHVQTRYRDCCAMFIPWLLRQCTLRDKEVVEIGSGSGSTTAALAPHSRHVYGYDMLSHSIEAARERMRILGLSNYTFVLNEPTELADVLAHNHSNGADILILYAVLEHQTLKERIATLEVCWKILRPGGLLVVSDTPNRLTFWDYHTSRLPFFNMLPDELAIQAATESPREEFRSAIQTAMRESNERALDVLARWGRGVSYHEFQIAFGDLRNLVVGDGFDPEILAWKPLHPEELLLVAFISQNRLELPLGFSRISLDLIFRKPGADATNEQRAAGAAPAPEGPALDLLRRMEKLPELLDAYLLHGAESDILQPDLDTPARARELAQRNLSSTTLVSLAGKKFLAKLSRLRRGRRNGKLG